MGRKTLVLSDAIQQRTGDHFSVHHARMVFAGNTVLHNVSLNFRRGEVHAIIGENGAGKSTLMKILGGYLIATQSQLTLAGSGVQFSSPKEAEKAGIVLVHQEILLAPHLTVAQNIFLGRELRRGVLVDDAKMNAETTVALAELGCMASPTERVENLSIANRQLVQIASALSGKHHFVIFDEPTATLTPVESEALFNVITRLKQQGCGVIYISHKLDEVKRISDRVSILRDGKLIGTHSTADLTPMQMANQMVGREMGELYPEKPERPDSAPALQVEDFSVPGFVRHASFSVAKSEILGFAGLIGAGRTELFEGILGLRMGKGRVLKNGEVVEFKSPRQAMDAGIAYVTEDRKGKGLLLASPLTHNLTLATAESFTAGLLMDTGREAKALDTAFEEFDIRAKSRKMNAGQLSGGNQQKLLLAKMMLLNPDVVVVDEPTRGVDIGAKKQIYEFISSLAKAGKAVVVISSEMPELIGLCHRIIVMRNGAIAGEVTGNNITENQIVMLATGTLKDAA